MNAPQHTTVLDCPSCGKKNRIPTSKIGDNPLCGECHAKLINGKPIHVTDASFAGIIKHAKVPVLVDFWAPWCGPCRMVAPTLEKMAQKYSGKLIVAKINTDENQRTPSQFGIQGIPTLILFHHGNEYARHVGLARMDELEALLPAAN